MHPSMLHAAPSLINYEEIELSFMWISHCDAGGLLGHSAQWLERVMNFAGARASCG